MTSKAIETIREKYRTETGEDIARWDGVFDPSYVDYLEAALDTLTAEPPESQDRESYTDDQGRESYSVQSRLPKPVEPCEDARELAENLGNILEYDEDCFDYGEQLRKAAALITADRERLLRDAADRSDNVFKGWSAYPGARARQNRAAILGKEE